MTSQWLCPLFQGCCFFVPKLPPGVHSEPGLGHLAADPVMGKIGVVSTLTELNSSPRGRQSVTQASTPQRPEAQWALTAGGTSIPTQSRSAKDLCHESPEAGAGVESQAERPAHPIGCLWPCLSSTQHDPDTQRVLGKASLCPSAFSDQV